MLLLKQAPHPELSRHAVKRHRDRTAAQAMSPEPHDQHRAMNESFSYVNKTPAHGSSEELLHN